MVQCACVIRAKTMSGTISQRVSKIIVLILAVLDAILAIGFYIKAFVDKSQHYKYIYNETEWNLLYLSLIATSILVFYGIFKPEHRVYILGIAVKVVFTLALTYAVIRGKLDNLRCERELCRFTESSHCASCYGVARKNKFEYDVTSRWLSKFKY